ncbi:MAG: hypothetical protein H8E26_11995 [FCB group bacterium]|nr:hypothetical protein [FCB group bacterium]MBL7027022.1 hypothetical protein [Candidatus Neomarinimicrobiota bacterium]MBL7122202.1 hypothetical protein [Candidatus Neomarinimicrobiota bacterium]
MIATEAIGWTYLAIADVPLDSIPDKILTKDEVIEAVILGFLPETLTTEARLKYKSERSRRARTIPLSEIVRIYDGKTRRNIALPVHTSFVGITLPDHQRNFFYKHRSGFGFAGGVLLGLLGLFVTMILIIGALTSF